MKFDIISIIYIVVALIFIVIGLKKGFLKALISFGKNLLATILGAVFSGPLAKLIQGSKLGSMLDEKISSFLSSFSGFEKIIEIKNGIFTEDSELAIETMLAKLNLPESIQNFVVNIITKITDFGKVEGDISIAEAVAPAISYLVFTVISFFIIFIVARLLVLLLNKIADAITKMPLIGSLDKLLGLALSAAEALIIILSVSYLFTIIIPFDNALSVWLSNTMCLSTSDVTISKYFYEHNFLAKIITWIQQIAA